MPNDPNLARQLRGAEDMKRALQRSIDNLGDQIRVLERQDRDAVKLPSAGREQQRIRDQVRQARRDIDRHKADLRTIERQISDLRRMR